ncbi:TetR/AcrR family transcriptional regulator [Actinosynnema sp. NPDC047251]|uniref:Transcriptional regulator, TetR family n=1 Tax=Saccharothrix espanaensis (strain ATCC 51144 / DSM 44229 / JCM 9112 / NBRC 15066 / NRRL 15764) TaxID=1179773 RepID=K0K161_SACES|nr:TetR/AcrR family transcriptional regulator [Saccharothrix espanaensis]CCH32071.1 Transcriptional regulator, TetR family [Saccharothrix espanaensis DSM 44229]
MARPPSVRDDDLSDRLAEVFRTAGYEGASLGALSEAAGLRRASLYHRFPDGKAQMAEAVLERVERLFVEALAPLRDDPDPRAGITRSARLIGGLYGGGLLSCVMDSMTLGGVPEAVRRRAAGVAELWIGAMADAARRGGRSGEDARTAAEDAFALMEGGLVHGRLFGDSGPFRRALTRLPDLLLGRH